MAMRRVWWVGLAAVVAGWPSVAAAQGPAAVLGRPRPAAELGRPRAADEPEEPVAPASFAPTVRGVSAGDLPLPLPSADPVPTPRGPVRPEAAPAPRPLVGIPAP